ncbi:hypothetical protein MNBD_GAMMA18-1941 [hydrothermal vent metagenome]|uniref:Tetratricopeptide repeat protein 21A/21B N-terminal ARM repeat domain-containing protein n=1 Tax=hydrothermal vent metagenome TaxID=652676 RepID=A0A3B0ZB78_9ZZZZ
MYIKLFLKKIVVVCVVLGVAVGCSEVSEQEHLQNAYDFYESNDLRASIVEVKNTLQINSENVDARVLLGQIYLMLDNGIDAVKELERAIELGKVGDDVNLLLGEAYIYAGQAEALLEHKEFTLGDAEESAQWLALSGHAYSQLGENEKAKKLYEESIELSGANYYALYGLALYSLNKGRIADAVTLLNDVVKLPQKNGKAWQVLGDAYYYQRQHDSALSSYHTAIDVERHGVITNTVYLARLGSVKSLIALDNIEQARQEIAFLKNKKVSTPDLNYFEALIAYSEKNYEQSTELLLAALKENDSHKPSLLLLGAVKFALNQLGQADMYLTRYLSASPDHVYARKLLGAARIKLNQPGRAYDVLAPAVKLAADDAQLLEMIGAAALRKGDFDGGRKFLVEALSKDPSSSSLRMELALASFASGDVDGAIKELEDIVKGGSDTFRAQQGLISAYIKNNQLDRAIESTQQYLDTHSKDPLAYSLLALVYQVNKEANKARGVLTQGLALDPKNVQLRLRLAQIEAQSGQITEAQEILEVLVVENKKLLSAYMMLAQVMAKQGENSEAIEWLEKAAEAEETFAPPRLLLARHYLRTGELEKARVMSRELNKHYPEDPGVVLLAAQIHVAKKEWNEAGLLLASLVKRSPRVGFYFSLAQVQRQQKQFISAKSTLRELLQLDEQYLPALHMLVELESNDGNLKKASAYAAKMVEYFPDLAAGYEAGGDLYFKQGRFNEAEHRYQKALSKQVTNVLTVKLYRAKKMQGDQGAWRLLENWLAENPGDDAVRMELAANYQVIGKALLAMEEYKRVLISNPENYVALNNLAWSQYEDGNLTDALGNAEKAYRLKGDDASILDTYGWILVSSGRVEEAENILFKAHTINRDAPEIAYHYAYALVQVGKKSQARRLLDEILTNEMVLPFRAEAEKLMSEL